MCRTSSSNKRAPRLKVISGAQTGADRAGLDAALALGLPCGGFCPRGRLAEDGVIPSCYPVEELASSDYPARTLRNVLESGATVLFSWGPPDRGSRLTRELCFRHGRPCLHLDARLSGVEAASEALISFIENRAVEVLNVAGARASSAPRLGAFAGAVCLAAFKKVSCAP